MTLSLQSYLDFAVETAYLAGRLTLGYFQTGIRPDMKADDTPVTAADRAAEQLIRERIEKQYPQHAIVGEEFGATEHEGAEFRWFVDPIDGTKSFVRGVPLYGVLIGLEIAGKVEVGAVYLPALDEMLAAASGAGCWWNGRRAHVSDVTDLRRATAWFTDRQLRPLRPRSRVGAHPGRDLLPRRLDRLLRLCAGRHRPRRAACWIRS